MAAACCRHILGGSDSRCWGACFWETVLPKIFGDDAAVAFCELETGQAQLLDYLLQPNGSGHSWCGTFLTGPQPAKAAVIKSKIEAACKLDKKRSLAPHASTTDDDLHALAEGLAPQVADDIPADSRDFIKVTSEQVRHS